MPSHTQKKCFRFKLRLSFMFENAFFLYLRFTRWKCAERREVCVLECRWGCGGGRVAPSLRVALSHSAALGSDGDVSSGPPTINYRWNQVPQSEYCKQHHLAGV